MSENENENVWKMATEQNTVHAFEMYHSKTEFVHGEDLPKKSNRKQPFTSCVYRI